MMRKYAALALIWLVSMSVMAQVADIAAMVSKIQTEVDTAFVYPYAQTKFVPPAGKTLLIIGQTVEDILEYRRHFRDEPTPGGWAVYWGVPEFKYTDDPYDTSKRSGQQNHETLVKLTENTVIQSAMWMVGKWDIAKKAGEGEYDHAIREFSTWAKAAQRPIYLRMGYEFDGPHNELEPEEYVKAYRHIADMIRAEGANNVAFVWHSYMFEPYKGYPLEAYYPGDGYVDWVGISAFGLIYQGPELLAHGDTVMAFAKRHQKPLMVAESSPTLGIRKGHFDTWDTWFVNFFSLCYRKNIKAISFITANWENGEGGEWKDARLHNNKDIAKAWFMETNKPRYLKQSDSLFEQLGYGRGSNGQ